MSSNVAPAAPGAASARTILFRRREIKYLIDRTTRTALTEDLRAFMRPDRHSVNEAGYIVRSLYFDTPDYMAYHEKLAGSAVRHKLRVRAYGEDPGQAAFIRLEVKSRFLSYIHKITVDVPVEKYQEIEPAVLGKTLPPEWIMKNDAVSKEFFRIQRQYNMVPKVMVQYRRQAFERVELNRTRANFDDQIVASRHLGLLEPLRNPRQILKYGNCVFEIKLDGPMPFWMHQLIGKYNLQDQAFSKFTNAIRSEARFSSFARVAELS